MSKKIKTENRIMEMKKLRAENRALTALVQLYESEIETCRRRSETVDFFQGSLFSLLNSISIVVFQLDTQARIVFINEAIERYGYHPRELIGVSIFELIHPDDRREANHRLNERRTGDRRTSNLKLRILPKDLPAGADFEYPTLLFSTEGIYRTDANLKKKFWGTQGIAYDVTQLILAERQYRMTAEQLQAVLDSVPGGISWMNSDLTYLGVNDFLAKILGKPVGFFKGKKAGFLSESSTFEHLAKDFFKSPERQVKKEFSLAQNGKTHYFIIVGQKYMDGEAAVFVGIDVTQLKESEKRIQEELQKRYELLREIHHRVKNNIQVIMCLMDMQIRNISSHEQHELMKVFIARIRAMVAIHEIVCRSPDMSHIDITEYFVSMANFLISQKMIDTRYISFQLPSESVYIEVDHAVPVGILSNELLLNIVQHAFPKNQKGVIRIDIKRHSPDTVTLLISDDGIGSPPPDLENPTSYGFQIVKFMINQLKGKTERIACSSGTCWQITFHSIEPERKKSEFHKVKDNVK